MIVAINTQTKEHYWYPAESLKQVTHLPGWEFVEATEEGWIAWGSADAYTPVPEDQVVHVRFRDRRWDEGGKRAYVYRWETGGRKGDIVAYRYAYGYPRFPDNYDDDRMDVIGLNGNDGLHYDDLGISEEEALRMASSPVTADSIMQAGIGHMQARAKAYDSPGGERSMAATVQAFKAVTGDGLLDSEERGWLFMVLLKAVRSQQGGFKLDSYEDGAAYFALQGEAAAKERGDGNSDNS